ncbi:YjbH domain-containing protein [Zunongwangia sp. F260]|uniref:YjbH domain-containing protein n=1 Tax=Autumnicola lenta TaxID=3075593 RepID=A0ABU3CMB3_9FLAO|nr:YjbH domain-containing protein [Zunongwangia sp. F260]MDT0647456.1 YjbH domain-containing protein [Zunongwangia sp. F260]
MRKIWISICAGLFFIGLRAQDIQQKLFKAGFENVQVKESADTLKIFFEHREFRNPLHSMRYAQLLLEEQPEKAILWFPLYHNRPIGKYEAGTYNYSSLNLEEKAFYKEANDLYESYRFHFRIHPDFAARFGYYSNPFQIKLNAIIDTRIYLTPGLSVQTGISIPLENRLDAQDMKPRLAPSSLHYFSQPLDHHFLAVSMGTFYYDRYGLDIQYRYAPLHKRWSFGLESGLTGFYWMNSGSFYAEELNSVYAVVDAEYRLNYERLSLRLSAGQFLFEDKGARIDIIKQFGTVDIGFFAGYTEAGSSGGFQVAFPIFPGTIYRNRKVEVRTTNEFRWEYSYNNEDPAARKFRIGIPRLADMLRQYSENFLQSF